MFPNPILIKEEKGIKAILVENSWMDTRFNGIPAEMSYFLRGILDHGWGNGYISLPKDHPWYIWIHSGEEAVVKGYYPNVYKLNVNVHGGITFGAEDDNGDYWVGFDTNHAYDNVENWPKERVEEATLLLFQQALDAYNNPHIKSFIPEHYEESIKNVDNLLDKTLDIFE